MKRLILALTISVILSASAFAGMTINFDDISVDPDTGWTTMPENYKGMTWGDGWEVVGQDGSLGWSIYNNSYNFPSLDNAAYNGDGIYTVSVSDRPFTLDSLYVSSWAYNDSSWGSSSDTLTLKGYLDGALVGTASKNLSTTQFDLWAPDLGGLVDTVEFHAEANEKWWLVDDMSVNPIPAPGAILLASLGAGLVGWMRRKRAL